MFKKYMCLALCLLMVLGTMGTAASAASLGVDGLTVSPVVFKGEGGAVLSDLPETASTVTASVTVSNNSAKSSPVVLWVGKFVNDVLVDVDYSSQTLDANQQDAALSAALSDVVKDGHTVVKAFVWTKLVGGKALAPVASLPSSGGTSILVAKKNGVIWKDFNEDVTEYSIDIPRTQAVPQFEFIAKDNSTTVETPEKFTSGTNKVTVKAASGEEKTYSILVQYDAPKVDIEMPNSSVTAVVYSGKLFSATAVPMSDRANWTPAWVGEALKDYYYFVVPSFRNETDKALQRQKGTFFSFTADASGELIVLCDNGSTAFEDAGWTKMNIGMPSKSTTELRNTVLYTDTPEGIPPYWAGFLQWDASNIGNHFNADGSLAMSAAGEPCANWPSSKANGHKITFAAGEKVEVPTFAMDLGGGPTGGYYLVKWDDPTVVEDPKPTLSSLTYAVGGAAAQAVPGFNSAQSGTQSYDRIVLDSGTESVTVAAETDFEGAVVSINGTEGTSKVIDLSGGTATVVVSVVSATGQESTYTVSFLVKSESLSGSTKLASLTYSVNDAAAVSVPSFDANADEKDYGTVKIPGTSTTIKVNAVPADANATAAVTVKGKAADTISITSNEIDAVVTVTAENGDKKEHKVKFALADRVLNLVSNDPSGKGAYPYNNGYLFQGEDKRHTEGDVANDTGDNKIKFAYSIVDGLVPGKTAPYAAEPTRRVTAATSAYFAGATVIRAPRNERTSSPPWTWDAKKDYYDSAKFNGKDGNGYWMEFEVSDGATVFMTYYEAGGGSSPSWPNAPADWTQSAGTVDVKLYDTNKVYFKHYEAGEKVSIPNYGSQSSWTAGQAWYEAPVYVIVWDSAGKANPFDATQTIVNTKLSALLYTADGGAPSTPVPGFVASHEGGSYDVTVTTKDGVKVAATRADSAATLTYSSNVAADGTVTFNGDKAVVTVTVSAQGSDTFTYTVNFTYEADADPMKGANSYTITRDGEDDVTLDILVNPAALAYRQNTGTNEIKPAPMKADNGACVYSSHQWGDEPNGKQGFCMFDVGKDLKGATIITASLYDTRNEGIKDFTAAKNTYYSFRATEKGTVYVTNFQSVSAYESDATWKKVNSGMGPDLPNTSGWEAQVAIPADYVNQSAQYPYYFLSNQWGTDHYLTQYKYAYAKNFEAGDIVEIYTGMSGGQNIVTFIQWGDVQTAVLNTLDRLTYNGASVPQFNSDKNDYVINVTTATPITIAAKPSDSAATVTIDKTSLTPTAAGATATVTCTSSVGARKYTVTAKLVSGVKDKILNFTTSSNLGIYGTDGYNTDKAKTDTSKYMIEENLDIGDPPAEGDPVGGKASATYFYSDRNNCFYTNDTSEYFRGATYIRMPKNDNQKTNNYVSGAGYDGKNGNPGWLEFYLSDGATVYMADAYASDWPNKPADWTESPASEGLVIAGGQGRRGSSQPDPDTKDWGGHLYYKHYAAGSTVIIPNYGVPADDTGSNWWDPGSWVIVWDSAKRSTNAKLSALTYTVGGTTSAVNGFSAADEGGTYIVNIAPGTSSVVVGATVADNTADYTIKVGGQTVNKGAAIALTSGSTTDVDVIVTAESGKENTFKIKFNVGAQLSSNADLSALNYTVGSSTTSVPSFAADTTAYNVTLPEGTAAVSVGYTLADAKAGAVVKVGNNDTAVSGQNIAVSSAAATVVKVIVTAEDTTNKTYTVTFTVPKSSNADLSALTYKLGLKDDPVTPTGFSAASQNATNTYDAVTTWYSTVAVSATPADEGATVTYSSNVNQDGTVKFNNATENVVVTVTAANGTTKKTHTLSFTSNPMSTAVAFDNVKANGVSGDSGIKIEIAENPDILALKEDTTNALRDWERRKITVHDELTDNFELAYPGYNAYFANGEMKGSTFFMIDVGDKLKGATHLAIPMQDTPGRAALYAPYTGVSNEYFHMKATSAGTVYVLYQNGIDAYENDAKWEKVANNVNPRGGDNAIVASSFNGYKVEGIPDNVHVDSAAYPYYVTACQWAYDDNGCWSTRYSYAYKRTFAAGEVVTFYPIAANANQNLQAFIQWGATEKSTDAKLSALKYTAGGTTADVTGFKASDNGGDYIVKVPAGTASVTLTPTAAAGGSYDIKVSQHPVTDGVITLSTAFAQTEAVVTAKAANPAVTKTYRVIFQVEGNDVLFKDGFSAQELKNSAAAPKSKADTYLDNFIWSDYYVTKVDTYFYQQWAPAWRFSINGTLSTNGFNAGNKCTNGEYGYLYRTLGVDKSKTLNITSGGLKFTYDTNANRAKPFGVIGVTSVDGDTYNRIELVNISWDGDIKVNGVKIGERKNVATTGDIVGIDIKLAFNGTDSSKANLTLTLNEQASANIDTLIALDGTKSNKLVYTTELDISKLNLADKNVLALFAGGGFNPQATGEEKSNGSDYARLYTITAKELSASTDNKLASLKYAVDDGAEATVPSFTAAATDGSVYRVIMPQDTAKVKLSPTANNAGAKCEIYADNLKVGSDGVITLKTAKASASITITELVEAKVVVTAESGDKATYTVIFMPTNTNNFWFASGEVSPAQTSTDKTTWAWSGSGDLTDRLDIQNLKFEYTGQGKEHKLYRTMAVGKDELFRIYASQRHVVNNAWTSDAQVMCMNYIGLGDGSGGNVIKLVEWGGPVEKTADGTKYLGVPVKILGQTTGYYTNCDQNLAPIIIIDINEENPAQSKMAVKLQGGGNRNKGDNMVNFGLINGSNATQAADAVISDLTLDLSSLNLGKGADFDVVSCVFGSDNTSGTTGYATWWYNPCINKVNNLTAF